MARFWKHVNEVLEQSDILIEVLDARHVEESRNIEIEHKVKNMNKILLFVINKVDLADKKQTEKYKKILRPSVFISSTKKFGTTILKKKIRELAKGKEATVGVLGYPNVGKSSLINALSGRHAARTSAKSGFTKGMQKVRVDNNILLLDAPGVYPYGEKNDFRHAKIAAIDANQIKDPEEIALMFIQDKNKLIKQFYKVPEEITDPDDILEYIANSSNLFIKGRRPDIDRAAKMLIRDWQTGKMLEKNKENTKKQ